uniref:Myb/SANT-like DNA-binding domain-containing protein n=1 Tax=Esox lucius TaxID=8010 RepID=A0AAY5KHH9_ESOLU
MNFKFTYSEIEDLGGNLPMKKRKSRFTFNEVHLLLTEVKRNRHILVSKFNQGASSDLRKRTWADIAIRINKISECQREVMEIVKKWADLKCDANRRMAAMRGPNGIRISQNLSPVEKMVHEILTMSPPDKATLANMTYEPEEEDFGNMSAGTSNGMSGLYHVGVPGTSPHAIGPSVPLSPFSAPDKDAAMLSQMQFGRESSLCSEQSFASPYDLGFDDLEEEPRHMGSFRPPAEPRRTYSRLAASSTPMSSSVAPASPPVSSSFPAPSSSFPAPSSYPPAPPATGTRAVREQLAHSASLSLQEQQATTALLEAVSGSLGTLAQSVQQLVESQQVFVRDSLQMQRETVSVLRDFSTNALALLRDKVNSHPTT